LANELLLTPGKASLADLRRIYREDVALRLDESCKSRVDAAADVVARAAQGDEGVYGINTGFGKLASTRIPAEQTSQLQRNRYPALAGLVATRLDAVDSSPGFGGSIRRPGATRTSNSGDDR